MINPVHFELKIFLAFFQFFFVFVRLEVQPRIRGWLLASVDGHKTGVVPANYVRVLGKRRGAGVKHSERNPSKPNHNASLSTADRKQQPQQPSTISATDDVWAFDDEK